MMGDKVAGDPGSFRDPSGRVYIDLSGSEKRILRGLNRIQTDIHEQLLGQTFFNDLQRQNKIIKTRFVSKPIPTKLAEDGWEGVVEHAVIPYISYPYEWTFEMLRDAALLQLEIFTKAMSDGWTLKDATPYNIQWTKTGPIFIDTPSFEPWKSGAAWQGYRQFCSMYLAPLLIHSHLGIDHCPLLRSHLDGLSPVEAANYFKGRKRFKKGVMAHIMFPARVEKSLLKKQGSSHAATAKAGGKQSKTMILALADSMTRLVRSLKPPVGTTEWQDYAQNHSYDAQEEDAKRTYISQQVEDIHPKFVWDLGCNSGDYSQIAARTGASVLALDGDSGAVEALYSKKKAGDADSILPLIINLANPSPAQGWNGKERQTLEQRGTPDLVICLALIHHMRLSANIPIPEFLDWLKSLGGTIVLEFVGREDEMVKTLLARKQEQYEDYNENAFDVEVAKRFNVKQQTILKDGKRKLLTLTEK